ncbi:hypothetical protein [Saccharopolyspora elongata]|uniref:Uncharacterized protein n=1 Tax=Saccharopolyspora elongata TaxID=2530387 RepID=A0A4R4ZBI3_9PSEU|nr:hypothetical protein [Saccharopolyspora elongata]TDD54754.1 hypothetical protein E1288_05830 [Saccharopolyspora elongata]
MGGGRDEDESVENEISGGTFEGPVSQIGRVSGDYTINWKSPKTDEEASFDAEYMAYMRARMAAEAAAQRRRRAAATTRALIIVGAVVTVLVLGWGNPTAGIVAAFCAIVVIGWMLPSGKG